MDKAYKNIWVLFVSILALIFIGFFKSYFSLLPSFDTISPYQHFHAALFLLWFALLFVQPWLISTGRIKLHRVLGRSSYVLVPLMVLTIFALTKDQYHREIMLLPEAQCIANLIIPLPQMLLFIVLYVLALLYRKETAVHMRYIIGTSIVLIGPGLGRTCIFLFGMRFEDAVVFSFLVTEILLAGLIIYDRARGNNYRPYALLLSIFLACNLGWYYLPQSALWQATCGAFVRNCF